MEEIAIQARSGSQVSIVGTPEHNGKSNFSQDTLILKKEGKDANRVALVVPPEQCRRPNFSSQETQVLIREVNKHYHQLYTAQTTREIKSKIWFLITRAVNNVSKDGRTRSMREIKKKWLNLKNLNKKRVAKMKEQDNNVDIKTPLALNSAVTSAIASGEEERLLLMKHEDNHVDPDQGTVIPGRPELQIIPISSSMPIPLIKNSTNNNNYDECEINNSELSEDSDLGSEPIDLECQPEEIECKIDPTNFEGLPVDYHELKEMLKEISNTLHSMQSNQIEQIKLLRLMMQRFAKDKES